MEHLITKWEAHAAEPPKETTHPADAVFEAIELKLEELSDQLFETKSRLRRTNVLPAESESDGWTHDDRRAAPPYTVSRRSDLLPLLKDSGERAEGVYVRFGHRGEQVSHTTYQGRSYKITGYFWEIVTDNHITSEDPEEPIVLAHGELAKEDPERLYTDYLETHVTDCEMYSYAKGGENNTGKLGRWAVTVDFMTTQLPKIESDIAMFNDLITATRILSDSEDAEALVG